MKEILKVNNLIKKFPKAGGEIDDADAISVLKGINFDVEQRRNYGKIRLWKDNTSEDPGIYGSADGRRCDL